MRINKYIAQATGISRRGVDTLIAKGQVTVNGLQSHPGQDVSDQDDIKVEGQMVPKLTRVTTITIMLNKPVGYVCSREGQGSKTIYELLPEKYHTLKPIGRLDKDSSGLLLMTNDGPLANQLTHPSFEKEKVYEVLLDRSLKSPDMQKITGLGIFIGDGKPSNLRLREIKDSTFEKDSKRKLLPSTYFQVTISEGRNRQIRRTFSALGYSVKRLHRTSFGPYRLKQLKVGDLSVVS